MMCCRSASPPFVPQAEWRCLIGSKYGPGARCGSNRKRFPTVYDLAMRELAERGDDIARYCNPSKELLLRFLVSTHLYGLIKK